MTSEAIIERFVSEDQRRMVLVTAIQCFEGKPVEGGWQGELLGTTFDLDTAHRWLDGEDVPVVDHE